MHEAILAFWFEQCRPWQWFRRSESFDQEVRQWFGPLVKQGISGGLQNWELEPSPRMVLLLDQFSRQLIAGKGSSLYPR